MRTRAPSPAKIVAVAVELLAQPLKSVHVVVDHRVVPLARLSQDCKRLTRWSLRSGTFARYTTTWDSTALPPEGGMEVQKRGASGIC